MSEDPDKPISVGPHTRVTFVGVALIGLIAGLCAGTWAVAVGLERLNRNMEDRMTHEQFFRWTLDARAAVPQLPMYIPPPRKE